MKFKKQVSDKIYQYLIDRKIYIRNLKHLTRLQGYYRITVGGLASCKRLYKEMVDIDKVL